MNTPAPWVVGGALGGLFVALAAWQRAIQKRETREARAALEDAKSRGAHKAIAQHPTINPLLCIGCGSCVAACPEDGVLGLVSGVARVIQGARCIGHARCEAVCPVGAVQVGLGDVSARPDLPILSEDFETTVPGLFIAGELGGIALIRNAIDQGVRAVEAIARRRANDGDRSAFDLVIVGAGPAGLAAGLRAKELNLHFGILDQSDVGGTIRKYPRRKMTLVQEVPVPLHGRIRTGEYLKETLIELWESLIAKHRLPIRTQTKLLGVERMPDGLRVKTNAGDVPARAVLLALGRRGTPRRLGVPGEEAEKVLYQLIDAASYRDQRLLVVGGGDSAVEAALALSAQPGNQVVLSYRQAHFVRMKKKNEDRIRAAQEEGRVRVIFSSDVKEIEAGRVRLAVRSDTSSSETILSNDFVFIFAGGEPPFPLLKDIGVGFHGSAAPTEASRRG